MNRRQLLTALLCSSAAGMAAGVARSRFKPQRPPNFVIIYCDDLGYGDVGATGGRAIPTPNLDRMAREGITLTDFYAPANV